MHHIIHRAIYKWSNYVRTINTIDTTDVSFHGVRSMQMNPDFQNFKRN